MNNLVIFTGAGCSAESGIPTFRDAGGLWNNHSVEQVCYIGTFAANAKIVLDFYSELKQQYSTCKPNAAHYKIAELQDMFNCKVVTSNVDMLLEQAGCTDVVHVHGDMNHLSCPSCFHREPIGSGRFDYTVCPACGKHPMKPGVVFFGEQAPLYAEMDEIFCPYEENGSMIAVNRLVVGASFEVISTYRLGIDRIGHSCLVDPYPKSPGKNDFGTLITKRAAEAGSDIDKWIKRIYQ